MATTPVIREPILVLRFPSDSPRERFYAGSSGRLVLDSVISGAVWGATRDPHLGVFQGFRVLRDTPWLELRGELFFEFKHTSHDNIKAAGLMSDGFGDKILLPAFSIPCHAVEMREGRGRLWNRTKTAAQYILPSTMKLSFAKSSSGASPSRARSSGWIMAESQNYILKGEYEEAVLYRKSDNARIAIVGMSSVTPCRCPS